MSCECDKQCRLPIQPKYGNNLQLGYIFPNTCDDNKDRKLIVIDNIHLYPNDGIYIKDNILYLTMYPNKYYYYLKTEELDINEISIKYVDDVPHIINNIYKLFINSDKDIKITIKEDFDIITKSILNNDNFLDNYYNIKKDSKTEFEIDTSLKKIKIFTTEDIMLSDNIITMLNSKQNRTDFNLKTFNKSIVDAINELFDKIDNLNNEIIVRNLNNLLNEDLDIGIYKIKYRILFDAYPEIPDTPINPEIPDIERTRSNIVNYSTEIELYKSCILFVSSDETFTKNKFIISNEGIAKPNDENNEWVWTYWNDLNNVINNISNIDLSVINNKENWENINQYNTIFEALDKIDEKISIITINDINEIPNLNLKDGVYKIKIEEITNNGYYILIVSKKSLLEELYMLYGKKIFISVKENNQLLFKEINLNTIDNLSEIIGNVDNWQTYNKYATIFNGLDQIDTYINLVEDSLKIISYQEPDSFDNLKNNISKNTNDIAFLKKQGYTKIIATPEITDDDSYGEIAIEDNKYYVVDVQSTIKTLMIILNDTHTDVMSQFFIRINTENQVNLVFNKEVYWNNNTPPELKPRGIYNISIIDNLASYIGCELDE